MRNEAENGKSLKENGLKCGGGVINYVFIIVRYFMSHFVLFNFLFQLKKGKKDEKKNLLTFVILITYILIIYMLKNFQKIKKYSKSFNLRICI